MSKNYYPIFPSKSAKIRFKYMLASNFFQISTNRWILFAIWKIFQLSYEIKKDLMIFGQNFKVMALVIMGPKPIWSCLYISPVSRNTYSTVNWENISWNCRNKYKLTLLLKEKCQKEAYPLLISTGFLKYPLNWKKNSVRTEKKNQLVYTEILFLFLLKFFFSF